MTPMSVAPAMTRVKICCIADAVEAAAVIAMGTNALGLVSWMPSGPGPVDEETIRTVAARVPPGVESVLLTCLQDVSAIATQHRRCRTSAIQLVDRLEAGAISRLKDSIPGIRIIQVVHVATEESIPEALAAAAEADALLLDSGRPDLAVKELGGTGRVHDWELSRRICALAPAPVFLAGGLTPQNVGRAIRIVRPYGVDVCSGVRSGGKLDPVKVAAFFEAVRRIAPEMPS